MTYKLMMALVSESQEGTCGDDWTYRLEAKVFHGGLRADAVIEVPEEFRHVTEADGLTVQVTAMGPARLWVESKGLEKIEVRGDAPAGCWPPRCSASRWDRRSPQRWSDRSGSRHRSSWSPLPRSSCSRSSRGWP